MYIYLASFISSRIVCRMKGGIASFFLNALFLPPPVFLYSHVCGLCFLASTVPYFSIDVEFLCTYSNRMSECCSFSLCFEYWPSSFLVLCCVFHYLAPAMLCKVSKISILSLFVEVLGKPIYI